MKKTFKKITILLTAFVLVLMFLFQASAETIYNYGGYAYYTLSNTTASLCGWDDRSPQLNIPKDILEYYIVEISDNALKNDTNITSVDFTKATMLNRIGSYSFNNCSNLSGEIIIPQRVNSLGVSAFQGCSSIDSLKMKTSDISVISDQAFYKCSNLSEVVLPDNLTTINKLAFADCTSLREIVIPSSVTSINKYAFKNDENVVIKCCHGSYAETFALENNIACSYIDPLWGDANDDGKVNIRDVTTIQYYKIGKMDLTNYGQVCADVNHDGSISIRDVTLIQMKIAKMAVDDDCF